MYGNGFLFFLFFSFFQTIVAVHIHLYVVVALFCLFASSDTFEEKVLISLCVERDDIAQNDVWKFIFESYELSYVSYLFECCIFVQNHFHSTNNPQKQQSRNCLNSYCVIKIDFNHEISTRNLYIAYGKSYIQNTKQFYE